MGKTTHLSITEAKQRLGEIVKRSAYGGERFVLEAHGKPQALIVAYDDLPKFDHEAFDWHRAKEALDKLRDLRERLRARVGIQPDSAEEIRRMREERDDQLFGLR